MTCSFLFKTIILCRIGYERRGGVGEESLVLLFSPSSSLQKRVRFLIICWENLWVMVDWAYHVFLEMIKSLVLVLVYAYGRRISEPLWSGILFVNDIFFNGCVFEVDTRSRSTWLLFDIMIIEQELEEESLVLLSSSSSSGLEHFNVKCREKGVLFLQVALAIGGLVYVDAMSNPSLLILYVKPVE